MTVTVDPPPEVAARLTQKAAQDGQDVGGYLQPLAVRDAGLWDTATLTAWETLIDSFDDGDPEDHRETVAALARGLNEDRPGQRRVFGTGISPLLEPRRQPPPGKTAMQMIQGQWPGEETTEELLAQLKALG